MNKVYIAGPMTGLPGYNFDAFRQAAAHLRYCGFEVVSPEELETAEPGPRKSWEYYLKRDLRELLTCNCIGVLKGWMDSAGATLEVYVGWRLGFRIFDALTLEEVDVSNYDFSAVHKRKELSNSEAFQKAFQPLEFPRLHAKIEQAKENILEEANRLVNGDRGKAYGHPIDDFSRTAKIWSAILGIEVPVEKVALCMAGVKISRQCNAPKRDNWTDMAGYAMTGAMVDEKLGRM